MTVCLGSRGASLLIQPLRESNSTRLQILNMRGNNLNPANVKALVEAFQEPPGLRYVEIAYYNFTTDNVGYKGSSRPAEVSEESDCSFDDAGDEIASQTSSVVEDETNLEVRIISPISSPLALLGSGPSSITGQCGGERDRKTVGRRTLESYHEHAAHASK